MLRFLLVVIILVALLLHNLPLLVRDQVVLWLLNNGADKAQLSALEVEWFEGRINIKGLKAEAAEKPPLQVDSLSVDLDYEQLQQERILISNLSLSGINLGVRQKGQALWLGPIDLNQFKSEEPAVEEKPEEAPSNWSFGLAQLNLQAINWQAELDGQTHKLQLKTGRIADFYIWDQDQPVALDLDGSLNGAPIVLQSQSKPLPEEKSSEIKVKLNNFPIHSVTAVFMPELRGHLDMDLNLNVRTNLTNQLLQVKQKGSVKIRGLKFRQDNMALKQNSLAWKGDVDLGVLAGELKQLKTAGQIKVAGLQLDQGGQTVNLQGADLVSVVEMEGLKKLTLKDLVLKAEGIALKQAGQTININGVLARGAVQTADMKKWQANIPTVALQNFALSKGQQELISLANLRLTQAQLRDVNDISLDKLETEKLKVQGNGGVFTQWGAITADDIKFKQQSELSINSVQLSDSKTRVLLSSKRQLTDLDWLLAQLSSGEEKATPTAKKAEKQASKPIRVKLNKLRVSGSNSIQIVDGGVKPAFKTNLTIHSLVLSNLDTGSKGKTAFDLKAKNKLSTINAKGAIELFSGNFGGHWDAKIKGLELPQVSPYSLEYTGYYLQSGQLSLTTKGTIKGRKLKGDTDIRLNKLDVEARNSERSGEFDQKVSMPLGTALMILQDNDDNIDLEIPIDGSLDDPQFGYQTVINKLAGKGLKSAAMGYLTKALQPFGTLISIGKMVMDAQEKGSFITLQPVYFDVAGATLNSESSAYLSKLTQMMQERKGMRMNICGLAVAEDQPAIWQQILADNAKRKKPLPEEQLQAEVTPKLQQLAQDRSDVVKAALSKDGIDIERLFSCYPKVDLKQKLKPQVSLGL
ncbi:DUF748 domain-containing protein [Neptuniibacter sp. QD29_5]|uniref:DUF748 domain-containing protein n=1 Tax=Neptuniibacter sp. QD29_5 TaxID=3398207 RepID=UPI0039F5F476